MPFMNRLTAAALVMASALTLWVAFASPKSVAAGSAAPGGTLTPCHVEGVKQEVRCGVYNVFENRRTPNGQKAAVEDRRYSAREPHPDQGPVFYMAGGPGETATELAELVMEWGDADEHEVVLLDERGTGD